MSAGNASERSRRASKPGRVPRHAAVKRIPLRQRRFGEIRIFVDTGERRAAVRDVVAATVGHLRDLADDVVRGLHESAARLDVLEVLPRLLGELLGEVLDKPRPARGIEHPADVGFLEQQQLRVAGHAPRESRCGTGKTTGNSGVERKHQHGVRATHPAANAASVVRSMFTHGSRCAIIGNDVTAWSWRPGVRLPATSATRAQSWRAARSFAIVMNWSSSAAKRKLICRNASRHRDAAVARAERR